jgi:hypothetical protein
MKKLILPFIAIFLAGCATARFDGQELYMATEVRYLTQNIAVCESPQDAQYVATLVEQKATILALYSQHVPNNKETHAMAQELLVQSKEFAAAYNDRIPSTMYCRSKIAFINKNAETIQQSMARKLRR